MQHECENCGEPITKGLTIRSGMFRDCVVCSKACAEELRQAESGPSEHAEQQHEVRALGFTALD